MSRRTATRTRGLAAMGATAMLGAVLPLAGPAHADDASGTGFTGFSASTTASPIKVEIFEPTIPVPASPQLEFDLGYSKVLADSSSSRGRASYLWPGDAVGEGAKTILEQLGLPEAIIGPIADQGYPVQVNSGYPSGDEFAAQEPIPGSIMRTRATQYATFAKNGFSSDCDVQDPLGTSDSGDGSGSGSGDGSGGLGGLGGLVGGVLSGLSSLGQSTTPQGGSAQQDAGADPTSCQMPGTLGALVDLGGYVSNVRVDSSTGVGAQVSATARAALGDVSLLGGLITMSGISATATSTGDGSKPVADGEASYGVMTVAGQRFRIGPDGVEAAGQQQSIPGLPDAPAAALKMLGITIETPGRSETRDGDELTTSTEAVRITIDTAVLQPVLKALPLGQILGPIANNLPDQAGPLKSLLLSIPDLAPKIVVHLGYASSTVQTVQGIVTPPVDPGDGGTGGGPTGTGEIGRAHV